MTNITKAIIIFTLAVAWMISGQFVVPEVEQKVVKKFDRPATVTYMATEEQNFQRNIKIAAQTKADSKVQVVSRSSGYIAMVAKNLEGQSIQAGEVLCRISDEGQASALLEASANLAAAQTNWSAVKSLKDAALASDLEIAQAMAQLDRAKARLATAHVKKNNMVIKAPFTGVLAGVHMDVGEVIQDRQPCATVINLDPIIVEGEVAEKDVLLLSVGDRAEIMLISGESGYGQVRYIASEANGDTRTFRVELEIPNPDNHVRAGLTADVTIFGKVETAHRVPSSALAFGDGGRLTLKTISEVEQVEEWTIELLQQDGAWLWITGLPQYAKVITNGQYYYQVGETVVGKLAGELDKG